jgi:hypothetical protein
MMKEEGKGWRAPRSDSQARGEEEEGTTTTTT